MSLKHPEPYEVFCLTWNSQHIRFMTCLGSSKPGSYLFWVKRNPRSKNTYGWISVFEQQPWDRFLTRGLVKLVGIRTAPLPGGDNPLYD